MKIRTWLMGTYLLVMILPLAAAYGFYLLLTQWDGQQSLVDSFELTSEIQAIEEQLDDPSLYNVQPREEIEDQLGSVSKRDDLQINLYRSDGLYVYRSDDPEHMMMLQDKSQVLKNLYQYDFSYQTVSVKKPVFQNEMMRGIYEIQLKRTDWIEGVEERRMWVLMTLGVFFLTLYSFVIWLLHKRFTRPLKQLMTGMEEFASTQKPTMFQRKKQDEIGNLMKHFERMQMDIEEAQEKTKKAQLEKQTMIASLSHDIKTPLTSVRAYAEALTDETSLSQEERQTYGRTLIAKTHYLQEMIEDLTTFAQLQSAGYHFERSPVDGLEFIEMLFEGYEEQLHQQSIRLHKENQFHGTYCMNDRQMIRVMDNLINNASRYTPHHGTIWMGAYDTSTSLPDWIFEDVKEDLYSWREGKSMILVQNEGTTIQTDQLEKIFTPFYQGDPARSKQEDMNSGLGLSIAKMIVERHNGRMSAWSAEGKGTVFTMTFTDRTKGDGKHE
ncbi:HAMP domain-containing histidine kinase [Pontibacillus sp. ALD_SL1]|uniref:sensor histidine kinase n=1 Tax=Pontibacillus sp. ALD_SL1 TaxID=2777185 RepID=UPI001A95D800|nr:HAMP domain-containing sensor histidine kinase [Pontibacillus sp. ALD_SL1]QST00894.1 HAMP domain-containing histidine kinase [Pontibacillus sp. ALD_SL1]